MFHPAPAPTQDEVEVLVGRASKRILRFLQRRGVITLVAAPGDGEVTVIAGARIDLSFRGASGGDDPIPNGVCATGRNSGRRVVSLEYSRSYWRIG